MHYTHSTLSVQCPTILFVLWLHSSRLNFFLSHISLISRSTYSFFIQLMTNLKFLTCNMDLLHMLYNHIQLRSELYYKNILIARSSKQNSFPFPKLFLTFFSCFYTILPSQSLAVRSFWIWCSRLKSSTTNTCSSLVAMPVSSFRLTWLVFFLLNLSSKKESRFY